MSTPQMVTATSVAISTRVSHPTFDRMKEAKDKGFTRRAMIEAGVLLTEALTPDDINAVKALAILRNVSVSELVMGLVNSSLKAQQTKGTKS
jgi:hypothetical protein